MWKLASLQTLYLQHFPHVHCFSLQCFSGLLVDLRFNVHKVRTNERKPDKPFCNWRRPVGSKKQVSCTRWAHDVCENCWPEWHAFDPQNFGTRKLLAPYPYDIANANGYANSPSNMRPKNSVPGIFLIEMSSVLHQFRTSFWVSAWVYWFDLGSHLNLIFSWQT